MEAPGNSPAATLLNLESNGSMAVSEGPRPVLSVSRLMAVGVVGYYMPGKDLGRWGSTVAAESSASGASYNEE